MSENEENTVSADKKVDAYLSLYKAQMEHFRNTAQVEWRVTFAAWTLLVVLIYVAADKGIRLPDLACIVFVLPTLHIIWLYLIQGSEDVDKSLWVSYRRKALDLLGYPSNSPKVDSWKARPVWKHTIWILLEFGVTLVLAFVAWKLLGSPAPPPTR
jgi:hypothetical protein